MHIEPARAVRPLCYTLASPTAHRVSTGAPRIRQRRQCWGTSPREHLLVAWILADPFDMLPPWARVSQGTNRHQWLHRMVGRVE